MDEITTETPRGRPQDESVTTSILQSTIELLQEIGFDEISIALVAERAGCGRGAVYRRWKGKTELIIDAFGSRHPPFIDQSGPPEQTLLAAIDAVVDEFEEHEVYMAGLVSAMREHPELKERFQKAVILPMLDLLEGQLVRVIGSEHPVMPLLIETVPGVMLHRLLFSSEPIDREQITEQFMQIVSSFTWPRSHAF